MTPNFKMDWGKKYPAAEYPHRDKIPVKTFDIREFVKEQKRKKLFQMMEENNPDALPQGGNPFPPFTPPSVFNQGPVPQAMPNQTMFGPPSDNINVDDLVKKIDAKIAALEAEEKRNKEEQATKIQDQASILPNIPTEVPKPQPMPQDLEKPQPTVVPAKPQETIETKTAEATIIPKKEPVIIHSENLPEESLSEEEEKFFDDFFEDE